jgi:hypothetical protein
VRGGNAARRETRAGEHGRALGDSGGAAAAAAAATARLILTATAVRRDVVVIVTAARNSAVLINLTFEGVDELEKHGPHGVFLKKMKNNIF